MPALSPTMTDGIINQWLVKVGDTVKAGDIIAEIETDKATMELEAPDDGVLKQLIISEGTENIKVNSPIAILDVEGEDEENESESLNENTPKEQVKKDINQSLNRMIEFERNRQLNQFSKIYFNKIKINYSIDEK